jgi:quercetin dioxygenase-like cupin family protein
MSYFDDVNEIVPLRVWDGVVARVWSGEQAALSAIELEPNSHVPEHAHTNEQAGILLRGRLTFRIGDESKDLRPGSTWAIPASVPHEVHTGPDGAFLIELFAPPRADWAGLTRLQPGSVALLPSSEPPQRL